MHNGPASVLVVAMRITPRSNTVTTKDIAPVSETDSSIAARKFAAPVLMHVEVDVALIPKQFLRVCA